MSFARPAALVILVASLGANALLGRALTRATPSATEATGSSTPAPGERAAPELRRPPPAEASNCGAEVADLERERARRSEAVRAVVPLRLLFERGLPNPAGAAVMRPLLAQALASFAAEERQRLECRDVVCKLDFAPAAAVNETAMEQALVRNTELRGWSRDFDLGEAHEAPANGPQPVQRTLYFRLDGPRAQGGR
jgi:hypothetical protein